MSQTPSIRSSIIAIVALALAAAQSGCQSKAHSDLYRQRMAGEIRVLEDKLHDAEYQNRVLQDRLERIAEKTPSGGVAPPSTPPDTPDPIPAADPDAELPSVDDINLGEEFDPGDFDLPDITEGVEAAEPLTTPPGVPQAELGDDDQVLPSPDGPQPPSWPETEESQIIPGAPGPPGDDPTPGQVILPDSAQASYGTPANVRIHPGLSQAFREASAGEGLTVVVNAVDELGRVVSLDAFDINADMSIVVLDPSLDPAQARIGRWDFSSQQVTAFFKSDPVSGLHVPLRWQDDLPSGDEVIVHVRLRGEEDEMRCEARLNVIQDAAIAGWTARGESRQ